MEKIAQKIKIYGGDGLVPITEYADVSIPVFINEGFIHYRSMYSYNERINIDGMNVVIETVLLSEGQEKSLCID